MSDPWDDNSIKAWHCGLCDKLMYNLDCDGYPAPGAPEAHFLSLEYPRVCSLCHGIWMILDARPYWKRLEEKSVRHLRPGGDYLSA